ncbi:shikimate dehydrogenase [Glutamicibacter sp. PS]|uniref:shikimate dehydrogenase family protein n=1 Tax=Glutamicibacter sp. PS TaxID=3075634 RepID=UPI00284E0475|nr:shikimate dehydrogenase [Glutamicibacter sp. PS]MDR4532737.1 shikimate dehydrogenase [Glutamicibacter sp. PS]
MLRAAVLGQPIGHSKSPVLHSTAYALLEVPIDYRAIDLSPEQAEAQAAELRAGGWAGCSVTMPLKDVFVPLMDELSDRVRQLGALNTIIVDAQGRLRGENTDVDGILGALADAGVRQVERLTVLGAGNTTLAAVAAGAELGVRELRIVLRNELKAQKVAALAEELGMHVRVEELGSLGEGALAADPLVISTLPPHGADDWLSALGAGTGVLLDVAYDPWPSALAESWVGPVLSGEHMLVHQAVEQVRLFSGVNFDESVRENVTNALYASIGLHREG